MIYLVQEVYTNYLDKACLTKKPGKEEAYLFIFL